MEIIDQIQALIGSERAKAYKEGFTDGIKFIKQSIHSDEKLEDFWNDEYGDDL